MTAHAREPRSRRERPAKPALTRAGTVATAVELMRAEGLDRVTTRRLAQELDTGPASPYVYVRNTAELHAAVLDELPGADGARSRIRPLVSSTVPASTGISFVEADLPDAAVRHRDTAELVAGG